MKRSLNYVHYGARIPTGKNVTEDSLFIDDEGVNYFYEDEDMDRMGFSGELVNEFYDAIEDGDFEHVVKMINESHGLLREFDPKTNRSAVMSAIYANQPEMLELFLNQGGDVERNYSLLIAAQLGNPRIVEMLIWSMARLEMRDPVKGRTPLMWAAAHGHTEAVEVLVDHDADVRAATDTGDFEDHDDGTAIHLAIVHNHLKTVEKLLEMKPFLTGVKNRFSETPLMAAAFHGRINIAGRLMKEFKADLEARSIYGKTALMIACNNDQLAVVKLLVRHGANLTARSFNMRTPLHQAFDRHLTRIVFYLVAVRPSLLDEGDQQNNTALHLAVDFKYLDYIEYFTKQYPKSILHAGYKGRTVAHTSAMVGYLEALRIFLDRSPAVIWTRTHDDDHGDMPVHTAVRYHQLEALKVMLEFNERQKELTNLEGGYTPLELATVINDIPIACYLAANGADLEATDEEGRTPLIVASGLGHYEIVKCLVENGADLQAKTSVQYDSKTALHAAARNSSVDIIRYLVEKDSSLLETVDVWGRTPLINAATHGQYRGADALIDLGAEREHKTNRNESALWLASVEGDVEMVDLLRRKGCSVESVGVYGRTPILAAAAAGHLEVVRYLVDNGANWRRKSYTVDAENTCLHLALYFGHRPVAQYLEETLPELTTSHNALGYTPVEYINSEEYKGPMRTKA